MIEMIRRMRRITSGTLADVLRLDMHSLSEVEIRDAWYERLRQVDDISADGWYSPPPKGIILAIGTPPNYSRMEQSSYRADKAWPTTFNRLNDDSLMFVYASPVHKQTGIIGDLACSLYKGKNPHLRLHLRSAWAVTMTIAQEAVIGMTFAELYLRAEKIITDAEMQNIVYSAHAGSTTDVGHTIPWAQEEPSEVDRVVLTSGTAQEIADLVSSKRRFVNKTEDFVITDNCAFTIEPRLRSSELPTVSFHVVVAFENGRPHVITEFDQLFELFDMGYITG